MEADTAITDIRVTNRHLAEKVEQERKLRGHKTMTRTVAEMLTERLTQLEMQRASQQPAAQPQQ